MKLALKLPQFNRNWLMLLGAIALGVVATGLSHKVLKDHMAAIDAEAAAAHKMIPVVVALRDLPRGARIDADLFGLRKIPSEYVHSSAVSPDQFGSYAGLRLGAPLKRGEALLQEHLESTTTVFSQTLERGKSALTTEVDEVNSISGMLRPTDHIDLMATARGTTANAAEVTFPLLTNVQVLATGQVTRKGEGTNQAHTYTTITLSVSPEDAERIVVAKSSGKLTAVLRNPEDDRANAIHAMNIDDVLPKKPSITKRLPVQYIVGGRS
jgi:pilus assembly protein CpaB